MTKIDIISGFLGAGKTTLIKKLLNEAIKDKVVLIENEFGEIGVDGSFLKESGVEIKEINSGCICCSLVGDFEKSLGEVINTYSPERIVIEPSGVGKLTDIIDAVNNTNLDLRINSLTTVVDGSKCKMYVKNFGEFFNDQILAAKTVIISRVDKLSEDKLEDAVDIVKQINPNAAIITTPLKDLSGDVILNVMEDNYNSFEKELMEEVKNGCCCGEHHHHHDHDDDDDECCCGEHHHHHEHDDDDDECCCDEHHHHHEHEGECCCGHHHGHHADEVFTSIGIETIKEFTKEELEGILTKLSSNCYGTVLRSKGILKSNVKWIQFDLTVDEYEIRECNPDYTGRLCVIGSNLNEDAIKELFK